MTEETMNMLVDFVTRVSKGRAELSNFCCGCSMRHIVFINFEEQPSIEQYALSILERIEKEKQNGTSTTKA